MKIGFRSWLEEHPVDRESRSLFDEAFKCYSVEAYRAALLFSYLGVMRIIARRVLASDCPTGYPAEKWAKYQRQIRDENRWEQYTAEILQDSQPISAFLIDDELRHQLAYWRNRRNDAAHSRRTQITHSIVESFWSFARTHLPRIVVDGGQRALLVKLQRHLDLNYTPPGSDIEPLVREIPLAIPPEAYEAFLNEALMILEHAERHPASTDEPLDLFISKLLDLNNEELIAALRRRMSKKEDMRVVALLSQHPRLLLHFTDEPAFIRRMWREHLCFKANPDPYRADEGLTLMVTLLVQGLIPPAEHEEAVAHVVSELDGGDSIFTPRAEIISALEPFGFYDAVERHAFRPVNLRWLGNNVGLVCEYLRRREPTIEIACVLASLYNSRELGPEELSEFAYFFDANRVIHQELLALAQSNRADTTRLSKALTPDELLEPFSE